MPDSVPSTNALARPSPLAASGSEMIAPSGKFWIAMPSDSASAAPSERSAPPVSQPASTTPTAMPSGMLCSVTASTSLRFFESALFGPSGSSLFRWRCGMMWSSSSKKSVPAQKPATAGSEA